MIFSNAAEDCSTVIGGVPNKEPISVATHPGCQERKIGLWSSGSDVLPISTARQAFSMFKALLLVRYARALKASICILNWNEEENQQSCGTGKKNRRLLTRTSMEPRTDEKLMTRGLADLERRGRNAWVTAKGPTVLTRRISWSFWTSSSCLMLSGSLAMPALLSKMSILSTCFDTSATEHLNGEYWTELEEIRGCYLLRGFRWGWRHREWRESRNRDVWLEPPSVEWQKRDLWQWRLLSFRFVQNPLSVQWS